MRDSGCDGIPWKEVIKYWHMRSDPPAILELNRAAETSGFSITFMLGTTAVFRESGLAISNE